MVSLPPLIGRTAELARLRDAAEHPPQLVVMRGRRRVGKSFLINHAYVNAECLLYFQADEAGEHLHLELLAAECERLSGAPVRFHGWDGAMRYIGSLAAERPLVVALDEFQWLWRAQEALPSTIMRHVDDWKRRGVPICMVIAGSELSMMERLLTGDRPLFGRADARPLIEPFDYRLADEFGPARASTDDRLRRYAILGGTAQYQVWAGPDDLETVLKQRILTVGEPLGEEPLQLLRGERELREPGSYYEILQAIASGRTRFNEIATAVTDQRSQSAVAKRLKALEALGYIRLDRPIAGNGTTSYRLADPYFRFWFRFVLPNRSRIQAGRVDEVYHDIIAGLDDFMGDTFEDVCRQWAWRFAPPNSPYSSAQEIGSYWTRTHDVEVDVVAMHGKRYLALGSCKWSTSADEHDLRRLRDHRDAIKGAGAAPLQIFARGAHRSLRQAADAGEVTLILADQLYA